jgi:rhodanese-related sulfurtransferase
MKSVFMEKREFKDRVYSLLSQLVKAMGNPHRLEIIDLLSQSERPVEEIAAQTGLSVANTSQHLQVLKQAFIVHIRKEGNFIYYRLANEEIYKCWKVLQSIGVETIAEIGKVVNDFRKDRNSLEPVQLDELVTRMRSKNVVLLDVRPEEEYEAGHIPGALSIPIDQLPYRINELKKTLHYIAYCRGPFCVFADDAVGLLSKKGLKASRLEQGFPDWKLKYQS